MSVARRISLESEESSESESSNSAARGNNDEQEENRNTAIDVNFTVADAIEELNEEGAGGDLDDEDGTFLNEIHNAAAESSRHRMESLQFDESVVLEEGNEIEVEENRNEEENNNSDSDSDDSFEVRLTQRSLGPQIPADWRPPTAKVAKGQPRRFSQIDNPGRWDEYCFRPKFQSKAPQKYVYNSLPTGARPVPEDRSGKRVDGGWEFFYKGEWESSHSHRHGATRENLFPDERIGSLDGDLLKKMGLTAERVTDCDSLFFHQLLLPVCNPKK